MQLTVNRGIGIVFVWVMMCGLTLASPASAQGRAVANPTAVALADFTARVQDYLTLQRKLADKVGVLDETKSPAEIAARQKALGEAVRAARASAKQGDIFTPAASTVFKVVIREEFQQRSRLALQDRDEAQDELPDFTPTVNQIYPTTHPLATFPPGILRRVQALPEPLEFRFVQRHLIIRDSEANLIVDILPNAAPPTPSPAKPAPSNPPRPAPASPAKPASR